MPFNAPANLTQLLLDQAKTWGTTLAGIAQIAQLKRAPSYVAGGTGRLISPEIQSVLVLALAHEHTHPELDWWDGEGGNTPGNRQLTQIAQRIKQWLTEEWGIGAELAPYQIQEGGIYLKDAGALAGLGIIGKNNLLITPEYGPQVRLRALFLAAKLDSTGPIDFDPCSTCEQPCLSACLQHAFRGGRYSRTACSIQMMIDESRPTNVQDDMMPRRVIRYCRACEWACPVGQSA